MNQDCSRKIVLFSQFTENTSNLSPATHPHILLARHFLYILHQLSVGEGEVAKFLNSREKSTIFLNTLDLTKIKVNDNNIDTYFVTYLKT